MKKLLTVVCVTCALAIAAQAQEHKETKKKHEPSPEVKAIIDKYDTNKDGKLDKEEKAKMTAEDKEKLKNAKPAHPKKEGETK
jgi:hypothetical protein